MNLRDFFPEHLKKKFAFDNIHIGKALLIKVNDFNINYPKYLIISAFSNDNEDIAFTVINSEINENIFRNTKLKNLHVKIDAKNHHFLKYDSFVNCSEIKEFKKTEVIDFLTKNPERILGNVSDDVMRKIHHTLTFANTISNIVKKKYGFLP